MTEEYKDLVSRLQDKRQYPILLGYVIVNIYYRELNTKETGITYLKNNNDPETIFNQLNEPYHLIFLNDCGNYFNVHKKPYSQFSLSGLPLKCKRLKIYKNEAISETLNLNCNTFEEELYHFITCLNYDIPKIKSLLNLNFIQSTRFIPIAIKIYATNYKTALITGRYEMPSYFGPNGDELQVRLLEGHLSKCTKNAYFVSLRDHYQFLNDIDSKTIDFPQFIHNYDLYNIYFSLHHKSFIPLVYNPYENPIIN